MRVLIMATISKGQLALLLSALRQIIELAEYQPGSVTTEQAESIRRSILIVARQALEPYEEEA